MIRVDSVVGDCADPQLSDKLHRLEHSGAVAMVTIAPDDLDRRRLRVRTEHGDDVAITLPRDQKLFDGAVILLEDDRALVVRSGPQRWLRLSPHDIRGAIELGYHCGNLHWRVRFDGTDVVVAMNNPVDTYLARIEPMIAVGRVKWREEQE